MQTALQLRWHNVDPSEAVAEQVREEVERLERHWDRITGCAVTLEAPSRHHRHSGTQYRVRVELSVPGARLVVGRDPPKTWEHSDLFLAVKAAFRSAERKMTDHVRRLQLRVKAHEPRNGADGGAAADELPARRHGAPERRGRVELLPAPGARLNPLHGLIEARRSRRAFGGRELSPEELGELAWAAQGITSPEGGRAAPSAGGLHPLVLTVVDARGVWRYDPEVHGLDVVERGDRRATLAAAALAQDCVSDAPATLVLSAAPEVLAIRYGGRAERYCTLEAGHAAENVLLAATALGLAAVPVAAFDDEAVRAVAALGPEHLPLYLLPVGAPAGGEA